MSVVQRKLSNSFKAFFDSEKSSGILLIICTVVSLVLANSILGANYLKAGHNSILLKTAIAKFRKLS